MGRSDIRDQEDDIWVSDLTRATLRGACLRQADLTGAVTAGGSPTSHVAILARARGIMRRTGYHCGARDAALVRERFPDADTLAVFAAGSEIVITGFVFPVGEPHTFGDSFGAPRMMGSTYEHAHQGTDIMTDKLRSSIWLIDTATGEQRPLVTGTGDHMSPRWSPDGRRLAFDARPNGQADVYVVDAAGGRPHRLTTGPSNEVAPSWSPDGRWLYFGSNRSGVWQVWKMPAEGGEALPVTRDGGYAAQASPDGRTLFFTRYDGPGLWQIPAAGGPETFVPGTEDVRSTSDWIVAPDGLLFARPSDDGPVLRRLDAATGRQEDVAALPGFSFGGGLTRTVDGRTTLFVRHDAGETDLLSLPRF